MFVGTFEVFRYAWGLLKIVGNVPRRENSISLLLITTPFYLSKQTHVYKLPIWQLCSEVSLVRPFASVRKLIRLLL